MAFVDGSMVTGRDASGRQRLLSSSTHSRHTHLVGRTEPFGRSFRSTTHRRRAGEIQLEIQIEIQLEIQLEVNLKFSSHLLFIFLPVAH